jgi:hypothetical protein
MYYAVDSNNWPVWLEPVTKAEGDRMILSGEAWALMPAESFRLVYATRHGLSRWWVFPRGGAVASKAVAA